MLSSSAVGATGPEGSYAGYAPTFACMSGAVEITGYPDEPPSPLSGAVDLRVGTTAAFAVLAALHHRQRSGEGQHIDLSSTEVMSSMIGEAFLEYGSCGRLPQRSGNRDAAMAPHNCYRCKGEEQWLSIAVGTEAEWSALRSVIADPELGDDAFAGPAERWQNQDRLDAIIERWTRERDASRGDGDPPAGGGGGDGGPLGHQHRQGSPRPGTRCLRDGGAPEDRGEGGGPAAVAARGRAGAPFRTADRRAHGIRPGKRSSGSTREEIDRLAEAGVLN